MTIVVVMGVSGCGKSSIGKLLAGRLGAPMLEGDSLHPATNIEKMTAGVALTDEDRRPWLGAIADWIRERTSVSRDGGVVACSALKRAYRDLLREGGPPGSVVFAHLDGPPGVFANRVSTRQEHFMPASLLDSQLATLERLGPDEPGVVVNVLLSRKEQVDAILAWLRAEKL